MIEKTLRASTPEHEQHEGALSESLMPRKQESEWNLEELTDADICTAIYYLDPESIPETNAENNSALVMICFWVLILLLGCAASLWLYWRVISTH